MINVTKTFLPPRGELDNYIDQIYEAVWVTNNGKLVNLLEKRLEEYLNVKNILLVANGTLALQVAYRVLGLRNSVITTPFSFVATTSSLIWENIEPVFADIDQNTFNIDPEKVVPLINAKTTGILPVHVYGNPCNIPELERITRDNGLKLVFDAAHAFNVKYDGQSILNYGDASTLSFHATKIFHTIEGGAVIFKNSEDYEHAKLLINFGISGYDKVDALGINCKMNEFQAAMGLAVLDHIDSIISKRQVIFESYYQLLDDLDYISFPEEFRNSTKNFSYFPILLESEELLLKLKENMNKEDIFPRRYFYPSLNTLGYLGSYQACPVSESVSTRVLCLPVFPGLEPQIQKRIGEIIRNK